MAVQPRQYPDVRKRLSITKLDQEIAQQLHKEDVSCLLALRKYTSPMGHLDKRTPQARADILECSPKAGGERR